MGLERCSGIREHVYGPGELSPGTARGPQVLAPQPNPPRSWATAEVRKGTSGRGRGSPRSSHSVAQVPATPPTRNSSPAPFRASQAGLPARIRVLRPARAPRRQALLRRRPARGLFDDRGPGAPFPSRPAWRPLPGRPETPTPPGPPRLTQHQQEQRPPGAGGRHGATQPRPGYGGCAGGGAGGKARPPTRGDRQLRRRHRRDPEAGSACHVSSAAPASHVSRGGLARACLAPAFSLLALHSARDTGT